MTRPPVISIREKYCLPTWASLNCEFLGDTLTLMLQAVRVNVKTENKILRILFQWFKNHASEETLEKAVDSHVCFNMVFYISP